MSDATSPRRLRPARLGLASVLVLALGATMLPIGRSDAPARPDGRGPRDVTVFALRVTPEDPTFDPDLMSVVGPLRELRLVPTGHGVRLLAADSRRLEAEAAAPESIRLDLGDGRSLSASLLDPLGDDGRVRLRVRLDPGDGPPVVAVVRTPPDQLAFLAKSLGDDRLLIGLGARLSSR